MIFRNLFYFSKSPFIMRNNLLLGLLLLCCLAAKTQYSTADSLKQVLLHSNEDSVKVFTLSRISSAYFYTDSDSAMHYAREAYQLSEKINFEKGEWQSLNLIGNILKLNGDFPEALATLLTVLQIGERLRNDTYIATSYNNIAEVYKEQGDYKNALSYYHKAKDIFLKQNSDYLVYAYLNIGDNYEIINQMDSALFYQNRAYGLARQINDKENLGPIQVNLGNIHYKIREPLLAKSYYINSIPYATEADDMQTLYLAYLGLARLFKEEGATDSALFYSKRALGFAGEIENLKGVNQCAFFISELYDLQHNTDSAYKYFRLATASKDSMFNDEKVREMEKLNFKEQIRQDKLKEAIAKEKEQRAHDLQNLGIVLFIITFFVGLILLSKKKVKPAWVKYAGLFGLLMLFEFISVYLHPFIAHFTHHVPVYMLSITVAIAALLVPLHHKMEEWVTHKLVHKRRGRPRKNGKQPAVKVVVKKEEKQ